MMLDEIPNMLGHNKPPSEMEMLQQRLDENYTGEALEYSRLSNREIPSVIEDEKAAGLITDYIKAINGLKKKIEGSHKKEKDIYLQCGRVVDGWKNQYEINLKALVSKASAPLQIFLDKKEAEERKRQMEIAQKARDEAERLASEAAIHANEGIDDTANELMDAALQSEQKASLIQESALNVVAKVKGLGGSYASQTYVWTGEIESIAAIDLEKLRPYLTEEMIQTAINKAVRSGIKEIRGVKIFEKAKLNTRG